MRAAAAVLYTLSLLACAGQLQTARAGIDSAEVLLRSNCPARTERCERLRLAYNTAATAYNAAVIADAAQSGEVDTWLYQMREQLKNLLTALTQ